MDSWIQAITTVGFPIVAAIALSIFIVGITKHLLKDSKEREEKLYIEITKNREVNQKAIETIAFYAERLNHIETDLSAVKQDVSTIKDKVE